MFFYFVSNAQLILNNNCQAFTDYNFFNSEFVKKNKIKFIEGRTSTKKENDIIRENDIVCLYEFNAKGLLIKQMYSHHATGYRTDTTTIIYYYDSLDRLVTKRQNDNYSFYSYNFSYDSLGNIIKETYCRDENIGPNKKEFKLGNQYEIIAESYSYKVQNEKKIKTYYNNYGKEYQLKEYFYNSLNYLIEEKTFYTLTSRQTSHVKYEYNEKGFAIAKTESDNDAPVSIFTYEYDKIGNLTVFESFLDNSEVFHKELLYDNTSMLLNATITKDLRTNLITIVKYSYSFY